MHPRNPHRWNRPDVLKDHYATLRKLGTSIRGKGVKMASSTGSFLRSSDNKGLYAIIGLLAFLLIVITALHLRSVSNFSDRSVLMGQTIFELEQERDYFKERYQIALEDAQAFGKIHGVLLNRTDMGPLERHLSAPNITENVQQMAGQFASPARGTTTKMLPTLSPWVFFNEEGFINDSCYTTTKLVESKEDVLNVTIIAQGTVPGLWPELSVLIDGTLIANHVVTEQSDSYKTQVALRPGTYHLDILYNDASTGPVNIPRVRIGDKTINNSIALIDYGSDMEMFDCQDTTEGTTIRREGAMRIVFDKV